MLMISVSKSLMKKNELTKVNDGDIYIKRSIMENNNIPLGGKITVKAAVIPESLRSKE